MTTAEDAEPGVGDNDDDDDGDDDDDTGGVVTGDADTGVVVTGAAGLGDGGGAGDETKTGGCET